MESSWVEEKQRGKRERERERERERKGKGGRKEWELMNQQRNRVSTV